MSQVYMASRSRGDQSSIALRNASWPDEISAPVNCDSLARTEASAQPAKPLCAR